MGRGVHFWTLVYGGLKDWRTRAYVLGNGDSMAKSKGLDGGYPFAHV